MRKKLDTNFHHMFLIKESWLFFLNEHTENMSHHDG